MIALSRSSALLLRIALAFLLTIPSKFSSHQAWATSPHWSGAESWMKQASWSTYSCRIQGMTFNLKKSIYTSLVFSSLCHDKKKEPFTIAHHSSPIRDWLRPLLLLHKFCAMGRHQRGPWQAPCHSGHWTFSKLRITSRWRIWWGLRSSNLVIQWRKSAYLGCSC